MLAYYEWKESWWLEQQNNRILPDPSIAEGVAAYACKQASFCRELAKRFAKTWLPFLESKGVIPEWKETYAQLVADNEGIDQPNDREPVESDWEDEDEDEPEMANKERMEAMIGYDSYDLGH